MVRADDDGGPEPEPVPVWAVQIMRDVSDLRAQVGRQNGIGAALLVVLGVLVTLISSHTIKLQ